MVFGGWGGTGPPLVNFNKFTRERLVFIISLPGDLLCEAQKGLGGGGLFYQAEAGSFLLRKKTSSAVVSSQSPGCGECVCASRKTRLRGDFSSRLVAALQFLTKTAVFAAPGCG